MIPSLGLGGYEKWYIEVNVEVEDDWDLVKVPGSAQTYVRHCLVGHFTVLSGTSLSSRVFSRMTTKNLV